MDEDVSSRNEVVLRITRAFTNSGFTEKQQRKGELLMFTGQNEAKKPQGNNLSLWTHCPNQNRRRAGSVRETKTKQMACGKKQKTTHQISFEGQHMMETGDKAHEEAYTSKEKEGKRKLTFEGRMQIFYNSGNVGSEMGPLLPGKVELNERGSPKRD